MHIIFISTLIMTTKFFKYKKNNEHLNFQVKLDS